jgi:hypothetical protein
VRKAQWKILALVAAVFLASFVFRFLNPDFQMEQFIRLVGARQILNGELPDRDFLNRGYTGMYYAAAAAMAAFGDGMLGDLVLTSAFVSLGAALTWYLSFQASTSVVVACITTLFAVAYFPYFYNYPKVFLPVLGLVVVWRYFDRRSVGRLLAVCAVATVAIVFRHDHGMYLGFAIVAMLAFAHLPAMAQFGRRLVIVLVSVLAFGAPYIASLVANGRFVAHVQTSLSQGGALVDGMTVSRPRLDIDLSQPLVLRLEPINVRWEEDVNDETRREREAFHQLTDGLYRGERTWTYALPDPSAEQLKTLRFDPLVEDTAGFDRSTFQQDQGSIVIAPGLRHDGNAEAWLYYATVSLPPLCLLILGLKRLGVLSWTPAMPHESPKMATAAVYGLVLHQALIRGSLDSRLADVSTPTAVLAAWVMGQVFVHGPGRVAWNRLGALRHPRGGWIHQTFSALPSLCGTFVAATLVGLTMWSAMTFGRFVPRLYQTGITQGPIQVVERAREVVDELGPASLDWWAPEGSLGLESLTRYVRYCTRADDRLMLTWLEPRPYFFSGRLFSGGMFVYHQGWLSFEDDQRLTVERLRSQSVPIVIAQVDSLEAFASRYRVVHAYIEDGYESVAESTFGGSGPKYRVLVDASRAPSGVYEPLSLPCYA